MGKERETVYHQLQCVDLTKKKRPLVLTCGRKEMVAQHCTHKGRWESKEEVRIVELKKFLEYNNFVKASAAPRGVGGCAPGRSVRVRSTRGSLHAGPIHGGALNAVVAPRGARRRSFYITIIYAQY